jgi:hypothetical protein
MLLPTFLHPLPGLWIVLTLYCWVFTFNICYNIMLKDKSEGIERYEGTIPKWVKFILVTLVSFFFAVIPGYNIYFILKKINYT